MNQQAVMTPMGAWAESRLKSLGKNDVVRFDSQVGSGFGKNIANWTSRTMAYPTNVLHMSTECGNKKHSAAFPYSLPEWFIKLFTNEGDRVLDPFMGSGTTLQVARDLGRHSIGIDILDEYCQMAREKLLEGQMVLMQESAGYETTPKRATEGLRRTTDSGVSSKASGKTKKAKIKRNSKAQEPVSI